MTQRTFYFRGRQIISVAKPIFDGKPQNVLIDAGLSARMFPREVDDLIRQLQEAKEVADTWQTEYDDRLGLGE